MKEHMEHTSLELSKRLHDKGFRAEHEKAYADFSEFGEGYILGDANNSDGMPEIPAYTFTELWAIVPDWVNNDNLTMFKPNIIDAHIGYHKTEGGITVSFIHESPAEALGLLVEWLIDEGHIQCDEKPIKHEYHGPRVTDWKNGMSHGDDNGWD